MFIKKFKTRNKEMRNENVTRRPKVTRLGTGFNWKLENAIRHAGDGLASELFCSQTTNSTQILYLILNESNIVNHT